MTVSHILKIGRIQSFNCILNRKFIDVRYNSHHAEGTNNRYVKNNIERIRIACTVRSRKTNKLQITMGFRHGI